MKSTANDHVCPNCNHLLKWHYRSPSSLYTAQGVVPCEYTHDYSNTEPCGCTETILPDGTIVRVASPLDPLHDVCPHCKHPYSYHETINWQRTCKLCPCTMDIPQPPLPTADHFSQDKIGYDQIPVEMLEQLARVFDFGASKYARDNWKRGAEWHEFYGSALRHIYTWWRGEDLDRESNLPHLAHAICNLTFLIYYAEHNIGVDDRSHNPKELS